MGKFFYLIFLLAVFIFFSGCETISSMKSGDLKMSDINEIVNTGFAQAGQRADDRNGIEKVDHWIKQNLW